MTCTMPSIGPTHPGLLGPGLVLVIGPPTRARPVPTQARPEILLACFLTEEIHQ
jgi:hypothetical protein